jgi:hypothetical protein
MNYKVPPLGQMPGMWRRALIIHADGTRDSTTQVRWLQAPTLFVDLRQSAGLPEFLHVRALDDLAQGDCALLALQEGFAGRLGFDGDCFEWRRLIDFQPTSAGADAGRLWWEDETLIEAGRDVPYVEHWLRDPVATGSPAALLLRDPEVGVAAVAVQLGSVFMFARERRLALPRGGSLAQCVAGAASLAEARAMLDCEISLASAGLGSGAADSRENLILASTHPWRVSGRLQIRCTDRAVATLELDRTGASRMRRWEVVESEGDPGSVWPAA